MRGIKPRPGQLLGSGRGHNSLGGVPYVQGRGQGIVLYVQGRGQGIRGADGEKDASTAAMTPTSSPRRFATATACWSISSCAVTPLAPAAVTSHHVSWCFTGVFRILDLLALTLILG